MGATDPRDASGRPKNDDAPAGTARGAVNAGFVRSNEGAADTALRTLRWEAPARTSLAAAVSGEASCGCVIGGSSTRRPYRLQIDPTPVASGRQGGMRRARRSADSRDRSM